MTYKDMTFCTLADKCATVPCDRRLTRDEIRLITEKHLAVSYSAFFCFVPKVIGTDSELEQDENNQI